MTSVTRGDSSVTIVMFAKKKTCPETRVPKMEEVKIQRKQLKKLTNKYNPAKLL